MFNEDGDKTLHRSEGRAVDHHGAVFAVVGAHVFQLKALRKVVINLHGSQLPTTSDGVAHHEVELGTVERGFAQFHHRFKAFFFGHFLDGFLRFVPIFLGADVLAGILRVAQADLGDEVLEVQRLEDVQHEVNDLADLFLHLVLGAENVRIVLGESTNARQTVELAALLVAVDRAKLRQTHRQIAI